MGGKMRFSWIAATIVVLSLIACSGPFGAAFEMDPKDLRIETPEYTGIIISEDSASEFGVLFDKGLTGFWEPSVNDAAKAEGCIRRYLVSVQDDPNLDAYQKENVVFILNNLEEYQRQYVGILVDGEKRIGCNLFLSDHSFADWERVPVFLIDGGKYFWQIEYDLPKDECINFYIHGEA
jgi:hypothetical protein